MNNITKIVVAVAAVLLVSLASVSLQDDVYAVEGNAEVSETGAFQVTGSDGTVVGTFDTFEEAINKSTGQATITMLEDSTTYPIYIFGSGNKNFTVDLQGNTLTLVNETGNTAKNGFNLWNISWKFSNGTIMDVRDQTQGAGGYTTFSFGGSSTVTFEDVDLIICNALDTAEQNNVGIAINHPVVLNLTGVTSITVNETNAEGANHSSVGVVVYGSTATSPNATLNVIDATIDVGQFGISGNGDTKKDNTIINIQGGSVNAYNGWGIYHPQNGTLNITGGTVSGLTGIEMRAGTLNMSGGTVCTLEGVSSVTSAASGNGPTTTGVGIAVVQHTSKQTIDVTVSGGNISGCNALYEANLQGNSSEDLAKISFNLSGGTFTSTTNGSALDVDDLTGFITGGTYEGTLDENLITSGYEILGGSVMAEDAKVTITNQSGTRGFTTLEQAFAAAQDGDTVKLLENMTSGPLTSDKGITLDLGGFTLTFQTGDSTTDYAIQFTGGKSKITNGTIEDNRGTWSSSESDAGYTAIKISGYATEVTIDTTQIDLTRPDTTVYNYGIKVYDSASLILNNGTKIYEKNLETNSTNTGTMGVVVYGPGGEIATTPTSLTVNEGVDIKVYIYGISGNGGTSGTQDYRNTVITVNGGTIAGTAGMGIYHPQQGELNINGGTITGDTGIEIRTGTINMSAGTVTGTGTPATVEPNGNGNTTAGVGIGISQHTTDLDIEVNISGGTLSGYHAVFGAFVNEASDEDKAKVTVDITGGNFSSTNGNGTNIIHFPDKSGFVRGGTFTGTLDSAYVDPECIMTGADGAYTVVQGYKVTFDVTPSTATIVITGPDGTEYRYDGDLYLADGEYTYTCNATGYFPYDGEFTVAGEDVPVSVELIDEDTMVTVTLNYPDELGWPSETIQVPYGGSPTFAQIPVEEGFIVNQYGTTLPENVTSPVTVKVLLYLVDPVISDVTVSYSDGVAYITVTAVHVLEDAVLLYYISPQDMQQENELTVTESGTYTVCVGAQYGEIYSSDIDEWEVEVVIPADPEPDPPVVIPPYDDDDYVPLPPQVVVEDGGDDEAVKIAACAAAAVAAAIIALILVAEYRKN